MSGTASSSLHQVGVPNSPVWCSSQVSKSSVVGLTVTGSLTVVVSLPSGMWKLTHLCGVVSSPSGVQKLTVYVEGFGYGQGNGPFHLGNAFASGWGLRILPDFPPTVKNGPYVDSWNAFFAGCQTTSCNAVATLTMGT